MEQHTLIRHSAILLQLQRVLLKRNWGDLLQRV